LHNRETLTIITAQTLSAVRNPYESNNHCETNGKTAPPIPLPVQMTAKARPFLAMNHSSMRYMAGKYRVTPPMPNNTPCVARRAPVVLVKDAATKALVKIARPTRLARRLLFGNRWQRTATSGEAMNMIPLEVVEMAAIPDGSRLKGS
jgi:hypothetical protein